MGQFNQPRQILDLSSTTTPKLVAAQYNASKSVPFGSPSSLTVFLKAVRAGGSAITAVKFELQGSLDGQNGWITLRAKLASDAVGTPAQEFTVTVSAGASAFDVIATDEARNFPFIRMVAKAVTADAVAGDSAAAFIPPLL